MDDRSLMPDSRILLKLANTRMPYGKYSGRKLIDLPDAYLEWFARKGFPQNELGEMLQMVHEIKLNGLGYLLAPLREIRR